RFMLLNAANSLGWELRRRRLPKNRPYEAVMSSPVWGIAGFPGSAGGVPWAWGGRAGRVVGCRLDGWSSDGGEVSPAASLATSVAAGGAVATSAAAGAASTAPTLCAAASP